MDKAEMRAKAHEILYDIPDEGLIDAFTYLLECREFWEIKLRHPAVRISRPPVPKFPDTYIYTPDEAGKQQGNG